MSRFPAPERWGRIAPLLDQALDLPPAERAPFLDRVCAGDVALRADIEALLRADSDAGSFLGAPVDLSAIAPQPGEDPDFGQEGAAAAGTTIGPYRVVREIGRGGMGVVYEAAQERPRRSVALKVILGGRHVDATTIRIFQREADSLARLKHPGIAAIYESGTTGEGQHFFAMELVQGRSLSDHLGDRGAPATRAEIRDRLALFRKICAAVAYAHQRGVIHRDLKPSNILVLDPPRAAASGVSEIKILDFGLARITDADAEGATALTAVGGIRGTLPYMSPEQVRGRSDEVDVRTDVYSLGVILYRLLAGRLPFDLERVEFPEAARIICDEPPRPPGAVPTGGAKIDRDLSIVVLKGLEKDPARRYATVTALDEDVGRYLEGQPILARPPSAMYQIRKLVARHKAPFAAAGLMVAALLSFGIVATLQARRIAAERDRANREAQTARRVSGFMTDLFKVVDPDESRGSAITAREILDQGVQKVGKELATEPEVQASLMLTMGIVYGNLGLFRQAEPILERAVETRRRVLGKENPDTLESMKTLATLYTNLDRLPDAERLFTRVVEARRRLLGGDRPETLEALAGLAIVYVRQGRYEESEKLDREVLEARRRVLGEDHADTVRSMAALANVYRLERRFPEAEEQFVTATGKMRRVLGEENTETLAAIGKLAEVYVHEGRYPEAERLDRETLETMRRLLGEDHPHTLEAMNELALLYDEQERWPEAEKLDREVLERRRRVLGDNHATTLASMNNLANVCAVQGRYREAAALYRESLEKVRRLLGENHPDTTNTLYNLGCLAALQGDRKGALDWLGQAVAHGYSHWDRMPKDSDLKSLYDTPEFKTIVARARKNAGQ